VIQFLPVLAERKDIKSFPLKPIIKTIREYRARYLIEALVIYSSIIGAFVPDNWKEERQDRKEEQIILNGLKTKW
jgi:hypothetical protein